MEQDAVDQNQLWFNTPDSPTLCRGGGNGPNHPTQLYAIKKYVKPGSSFLDYGSGSGTTWEALKELPQYNLLYTGLDVIQKNVDWCNKNFPEAVFEHNPTLHKIDQPDHTWNVVYSRHVVDHMRSFEEAMDEHKRVSNDLVIVILWTGLIDKDEHEIKNIVDHRGTPEEKLYKDEYTNNYSRSKVLKYLNSDPEWTLLELSEEVGKEVSGFDTVIVLKRNATQNPHHSR